jgi:hypothetical protein
VGLVIPVNASLHVPFAPKCWSCTGETRPLDNTLYLSQFASLVRVATVVTQAWLRIANGSLTPALHTWPLFRQQQQDGDEGGDKMEQGEGELFEQRKSFQARRHA